MQTDKKFVITIARELGSGGRTVGRKLAEKLGVRYCDKDLINTLVKEFDLSVDEIERIKGRKSNWLTDFLERIAPMPTAETLLGTQSVYGDTLIREVTSDSLYAAEREVLKALTEEGSCVVAGRSAFFALDDHPNKADILIISSMESRIARVMQRQGVDRKQAEATIKEVDAQRENYVKHFAGVSRYDARNYDLVLRIDGMSEDDAVACILDYLGRKES
ncbi:MAG: cytidylate kinase-like family protein [Bacteroidales bacterium]|nr:cytidylate kinase-like family protein [Bacteroidales bacterium]